jgi:Dolichyl-phosphate-mannose-protein mannosyltransferase
MGSAETQVPGKSGRFWAVAGLLAVLVVVAVIRLRLLDFPLERDEGEFAYAGQMLLQGASPYDEAYTTGLKLPGTTAAYALIMALFGQTAAGIHLGLLLVNLASAVLVFIIARRIYGNTAGAIAAGTFALLSIIPKTTGLAAHATHFVVLPALAGIALLQPLDARTSARRIFLAGLLVGLALAMKQTGAFFGLFAAGWVLRCELASGPRAWGRLTLRLVWLAAGGLLPFALTCLLVAMAGDFGRFWFWAFTYAAAHGTVIHLANLPALIFQNVADQFNAAPGLWSLALAGLPLLFAGQALRGWRFFLVSLAVCSFLAVCPGGYFRGHYFIQFVPAAGLLAGAAFHAVSNLWGRLKLSLLPAATVPLLFAAAGGSALLQWSDVYFRLTPAQACHALYGTNPFPEALEISRYLEAHTAPGARIAVFGSEPEIFFYSHRRSATGHICTYPLVESQPYAATMRAEMTREIERADPAYVVSVNVQGSWVQSTAKMDTSLFDWFDQYRRTQLELVGLVELPPGQPAVYRWFDHPQTDLQTGADAWVAIFKKRDAAPTPPAHSPR